MRGISRFYIVLSFVSAGCGQHLGQFNDEDKDIIINLVSDSTAAATYSITTRIVSFSFTFKADRTGSYRVLHGSDCGGNRLAGGSGVSGALLNNTAIAVDIRLSYDDTLLYGKDLVICVEDSAAYKKASLIKNFATGLASALSTATGQLNENYGGGGANIDSGFTGVFPLFQANFTSGNANRGGSVAANGVSNPYSHGAYFDPNDGYRYKYIVVDRGNHRVLIFNTIPTSAAASADVVVGQTTFTASGMNAGAGATVNDQGFREPVHASVSNSGALFVTDYQNNRVVVFNTIPTTNGKTADFVIGQNTVGDSTANAFGAGDNRNLNRPYACHAIGGRLYIVDQNNNRVVVFNSIPTSIAPAASFVIGQADFTGTGTGGADYTVGANTDYMSTPYDVLVYSNRLYVSDTGHHRILVFTTIPSASNARPTYVIGHTGPVPVLANQGGAVSANGLNFPGSMAAQNNKLAVADQVNNRVLFFDLPIIGDNQAAQQAIGQGISGNCPANCTSSASTTTDQRWFNLVKGLIFDNGYIWAADGGRNRVQVLALPY